MNILIAGANSYIGASFEKWLKRWPDRYNVDTVDMIDGSWREKKFAGYDVIFHVAGIAHVDQKNATKETDDLYYKINCDLAIETAIKAKTDGVKQFVFMSSIIVYGDSSPFGEKKLITKDTVPNPSNVYGDSKLKAENGIFSMQSDNFKIAAVRAPMIYGKGSKGNYARISKFARRCPIFPDVNNQRSILYIGNLCEMIRLLIDNHECGIYYPQNREYIRSFDLAREIAKVHGKHMYKLKLFHFIICFLQPKISLLRKLFGNQAYSKELSNYYNYAYCVYDFAESIRETENC